MRDPGAAGPEAGGAPACAGSPVPADGKACGVKVLAKVLATVLVARGALACGAWALAAGGEGARACCAAMMRLSALTCMCPA